MNKNDTTLHYWTADGLTLADAARAWAGFWAAASGLPGSSDKAASGPVALLYSPQTCILAVYREAAFWNERGQQVPLRVVFEARVFNGAGELRWRNEPQRPGLGRCVFVTEQELPAPDGWATDPLPGLQAEPNQYLLWGEPWTPSEPLATGWSCLAAGRIGQLPVPSSAGLSAGQRLQLSTREYFGIAPGIAGASHGNWAVLEERLLGLEVYCG